MDGDDEFVTESDVLVDLTSNSENVCIKWTEMYLGGHI